MKKNLRKRIKQQEKEIKATKLALNQEHALLHQKLTTPAVMSFALLAGFSTAFLFKYYGNNQKAKRAAVVLLGGARKIYKNAKSILTILAV